jgi:uncharacterized RDD family membrane protein YckC
MTAAVGATGQRAGFVTRLAALIADTIIVSAAVRGTVWLLLQAERALRRFAPPFSLGKLLLVCGPLIACLYCIVFWSLRGQTPGKWLLGLRVVALGGGRVGIGQSVVRFVGYLLSAVPFYLGFLWVLGPRRRGFHDRLAGTEVVYARRPGHKPPSPNERALVPRRYATAQLPRIGEMIDGSSS